MMPGNVPSPASADSPFNGDGSQSRPNTGQFGGPPGQGQVQGGMAAQNRPPGPPGPPPSKMMPPPQSPGMSHTKNPNPPKDGHPDGSGVGSSPRNAPQPGQQGQSMAGPQGQSGQPVPQGPNRSPGGPMKIVRTLSSSVIDGRSLLPHPASALISANRVELIFMIAWLSSVSCNCRISGRVWRGIGRGLGAVKLF